MKQKSPMFGRPRQGTVEPRVKSGPVNRSLLMAGGFGAVAWMTWPTPGSDGLLIFYNGLSLLCAVVSTGQGLKLLARDYRLRRNLAISRRVTTDHGSARQSTHAERVERGMDDQRNGELFGHDDDGRPVFRPKGAPFAVIEMPPGVGKTVALVIGSILHRARLGYSVVVPDVKNELAVMLVRSLRKLGYEVWCINPAGRHLDVTGDTELNPYQPILDALYGDADERKNAIKIANDYATLHYPVVRDEKNPYFTHGSRRAIVLAILILAMLDPANCTPTTVYLLIADPKRFLSRCKYVAEYLDSPNPDDRVMEVMKTEARNMLHRAEKNEENFASFLEGAGQKFIPFNPAGHLGRYGSGAIHNLKDIRSRQIIVFIMTPLSHMREFSDFISLLNHNIIAACKAKPDGHLIHIVGEEALNYRFHDLVGDLETMRQLGVTADFYIQSFAGLERHYGKDAAAAIESYADIRIYAGLNSLARAKHVSDLLSEATIRKQDASYSADVTDLGLSSREMARPLMKPDEVLSMERNRAWMFVRGLHPTRLTMVTYAQVSPWRDEVDASPITGTRLHGEAIIQIDYPDKGEGP